MQIGKVGSYVELGAFETEVVRSLADSWALDKVFISAYLSFK